MTRPHLCSQRFCCRNDMFDTNLGCIGLFQLGLPLSCLCTVPCSTMSGSTHKMDISTLEKLVEDDVASGKTPVLVVAYAGTPLVGHVDNIQHLQDLCKKAEIWLHIEG